MKRFLVALSLVLGVACKTTEESKTPEDTSALERLERGAGTTTEGDAAVDPDEAAEKAAAQKVLAKVRDRDPEEEKRKLAQSRQRSAQARKMLRGGRYDEAVANARAALKIHEQNVDAMLVLAEVFFREKKYELTVSVTGTALAVDEKIRTPRETSTAYNLQGFAFASMGQNQRATKAFKKAAESDDKNAAAWNNLGTRYLRGGDVKTAAQCFAYAIELSPGFAKAHLNHGAALRAQGKWKDAEKEFLRALELKKVYPEAFFNLGLLYLDADPFPELSTVQRLNKAILYLEKYKGVATDVTSEPVPKGVGNKKDLAPVSRTRADDYIRVAQKGLDREARRTKREQERAQKGAGGDDEGGGEAAPGGSSPQKPGAKPSGSTPHEPGATEDGSAPPSDSPKPTQPHKPGTSAPQKPGTNAPQKPGTSAPQKPGTSAPQKPGTSAPQKPGTTAPQSPGTTAPQKPGTSAPQKPGTTAPQKPAPTKPTAPQKPAPTPPAKPSAPPHKPGAPTHKPGAPPPRKPGASPPSSGDSPGVQRPGQKQAATSVRDGSAVVGGRPSKKAPAWNPRLRSDTKEDGVASLPAKRAWHPNVQAPNVGTIELASGRARA